MPFQLDMHGLYTLLRGSNAACESDRVRLLNRLEADNDDDDDADHSFTPLPD